jgi:predicted nuclease of restriction endonuclease-like (RecB) superfamily
MIEFMKEILNTDLEYRIWLGELKERLRQSQLKAAIAVNAELLRFYWHLGSEIVRLQANTQWGSGFLKQLSKDLTDEFKGVEGFSETNLKYVRQFYERYLSLPSISPQVGDLLETSDSQSITISPQAGDQLIPGLLVQVPWAQHKVILSKVKDLDAARFYMEQTVRYGWSRSVLAIHIDRDEYGRRGKAVTNFALTIPAKDSDLEQETLKNPYNFDFLTIGTEAKERDIEQALVKEVGRVLLELGEGFAYVGRQRLIEVEGDVFFPDLIFFNYINNRFFVFELKAGKAKPEHLGQLSFYVQLINERLKTDKHEETIGVLLSRDANKKVMQTALNGFTSPLGQVNYTILESLPVDIQGQLPSVEEIEHELVAIEAATVSMVEAKLAALREAANK